jgi:glycosyltransferase involved in cell wall biosynthesis
MKLSILTPSYNQAEFLERCLASVREQGHADVEHIVVDGGSTDGSAELLQSHARELAWWVSEPDGGQSHALNKALARATGDVVGWINSDDYYLPGAFDAALPLFESEGVEWVAGSCRFLFSDGTLETVWRPEPPALRPLDLVLTKWSVPQSASFWRRSVFDRVGSFREDLTFVFDTEFMLRLALAGIEPTLVDRELAVRWLHEAAKSADRRPFDEETVRIVAEHVSQLPLRERLELLRRRVARGLQRLRPQRA